MYWNTVTISIQYHVKLSLVIQNNRHTYFLVKTKLNFFRGLYLVI